MNDEISRRGFLHNVTAASLAAFFAGKITAGAMENKALAAPAFDFRRVCWGMSQGEVVASENVEAKLRMPAVVMYSHTLDQLPVTLTFQFAQQRNEIVCVAAVLQTDLMQNMLYIDINAENAPQSRVEEARLDYERIKQVLSGEFGDPTAEDIPYRDDELVQVLRSERAGNLAEEAPPIPRLASYLEELRGLSHTDATLKSLMRSTHGSGARTEISLGLRPMSFGGTMLMVRHDSAELARLIPGHPDYRPT